MLKARPLTGEQDDANFFFLCKLQRERIELLGQIHSERIQPLGAVESSPGQFRPPVQI